MLTNQIFANKGLNLDVNENIIPDNSLVYLLNGDITGYENGSTNTFVQNTLSNELCFQIPFGYELKGVIKLSKEQFALFFKTPTSSEIGLFDANLCSYIPRLNNVCLGFTRPIKGVFKNLPQCDSRRVYFLEEGEPLRFFDIDECLPLQRTSDCSACDPNDKFNCDLLNVNRCVTFPQIIIKETQGNLPNGSYQIGIALTDDKQRYTEYYIYPEIIKFHSQSQGDNRFGIQVDFASCAKGFDQYELVLISNRTDAGTLIRRVGYFDVTQKAVTIAEYNDTNYTPIDLQVFYSQIPRYRSADHIATNNETLVLGGVTLREPVNYQFRALDIQSNWVVKRVKAKQAADFYSYMRGEVYAHYIRGIYCDGERTASYLIPPNADKKIKDRDEAYWKIITKDVTGDDVYETGDACEPQTTPYWEVYDTSHIICQEPNAVSQCFQWTFTVNNIQLDNVTAVEYNYTYTDCCGDVITAIDASGQLIVCTNNPESVTVSGIGGSAPIVNIAPNFECPSPPLCPGPEPLIPVCGAVDCDGKIVMKGDFAYWHSGLITPNNPCVWGQRDNPIEDFFHPYGLSCQPVKYHKFPENCKTHIHTNSICGIEEEIDVLGIEFSGIPSFLDKDGIPIKDIVGYEILVADRTNHKSIIHKGLMYNMWEEKLADCTTSYYANYPFNDLRPDVFLSQTPSNYDGSGQFGEVGYDAVDKYSRNKFQYISPDISFERNDQGAYIKILAEENGELEGNYDNTFDMPPVLILSDLFYLANMVAFTALILATIPPRFKEVIDGISTIINAARNAMPPVNYAINYLARTFYKGYNCNKIIAGNIRRKIVSSQYLLPTKMYAGNYKVNNLQRESGLFIELNKDIQDPFVQEYSRIKISENGCAKDFGVCETVNGITPKTSSYYAGIYQKMPNQYGLPDSTQLRVISGVVAYNNIDLSNSGILFGGDIKITKHKYIRKFPFFTNLPLGLPVNTFYETKPYMNIWFTRYWLDHQQDQTFLALFTGQAITDNDSRNLEKAGKLRRVLCGADDTDCNSEYVFRVDGKFYTHVIGEAHYWCESEYVGDYRELNEIPESNVDRTDQEKALYRTIQYPELFLYNRQYHWRGLSQFSTHSDMFLDCCKLTVPCYKNRIAYSSKNDPLSKSDNWLKFLPNSFQQLSQKDGNLTGFKEIDENNLLIAFEDAMYVTQQDDSIVTENGRLYIGSAGIFERRLKRISDDVTGFGGCIDLESIIPTRYGAFWWDRKRRKFIRYTNNIEDQTNNIQSWAQEFVSDGPIIGVFDNFTDNIYYSGDGWTISYKPRLQDFVSFHSFVPEKYHTLPNNFLSYKDNGFWKHNKKYEYQTYYGIKYPFDIGFVVKDKFKNMVLQDIEVYSEWIKYNGYNCRIYAPKKFFNKILAYNNFRSTGVRDIIVKHLNNEGHYTIQNHSDFVECTALDDSTYRLNKFTAYQLNQPFTCWDKMDYRPTEEIKYPTSNTIDQAFMRGRWFRVHLINDIETEYKILLQLDLSQHEEINQ